MAGLIKTSLYTAATVALIGVAGSALTVGYTETQCRAEPTAQIPAQFVTDRASHRPEARTFLTYPEWHIVYAYQDMARTLTRDAAHQFDYSPAITGFWSSLCAVRAEADRVGDPGMAAKLTSYTIGVSFTVEMLMKGAYEETFGRISSLTTSGSKTAQDIVEARMAKTYGAFLHQRPWYLFDFNRWTTHLWEQPIRPGFAGIRSWERRLALGIEWKTKALYAKVMAYAAGTVGHDPTRMMVHVEGLSPKQVSSLPSARIVSEYADGLILEVERYDVFTKFVQWASRAGARINEIAGNDDILVSVIGSSSESVGQMGAIIREIPRSGSEDSRYLVSVGVNQLTDFVRQIEASGARLEHVYDY